MNDEVRMMLCGPLKHIKGLPSYAMSSRSVSTKKRQAHHNASYQALSRLKKRITDFIQYMYKLMASFTPSTPHHISMDSLQLQEEAYEIERKVIIEIDTPLANHRNLDQTVEALHREIDHLYARYHSLVSQLPRGSLPMASASSTRSAARPPLHPSMSHQSISRRSHTRKNANNRKN
jgi:transcriptional regulator with GAF, ATPase, and Fis domain